MSWKPLPDPAADLALTPRPLKVPLSPGTINKTSTGSFKYSAVRRQRGQEEEEPMKGRA